MHLEFEGNMLCLHRDDVEFMLQTNCVWLAAPEGPAVRSINDRYVGVEGVVNADDRGHFGMFQASIQGITAIGALPTRAAMEALSKAQRP
jgi:hypothetical protein